MKKIGAPPSAGASNPTSTPADPKRCSVCQATAPEPPARVMMRCSGCRQAYYCGEACQRADWKAAHKNECLGRNVAKALPPGAPPKGYVWYSTKSYRQDVEDGQFDILFDSDDDEEEPSEEARAAAAANNAKWLAYSFECNQCSSESPLSTGPDGTTCDNCAGRLDRPTDLELKTGLEERSLPPRGLISEEGGRRCLELLPFDIRTLKSYLRKFGLAVAADIPKYSAGSSALPASQWARSLQFAEGLLGVLTDFRAPQWNLVEFDHPLDPERISASIVFGISFVLKGMELSESEEVRNGPTVMTCRALISGCLGRVGDFEDLEAESETVKWAGTVFYGIDEASWSCDDRKYEEDEAEREAKRCTVEEVEALRSGFVGLATTKREAGGLFKKGVKKGAKRKN